MYRRSDLQFLQDIYERPSNDIALLYGHKSAGLFEIVTDLIHDKECVYYKACAVDDRTQKRLFASALHDQTRTPVFPDDDYERLIISYINDRSDKKKIIVLDDFSYLIKEDPTFINFLASLITDRCNRKSVMFLLVSSDIKWVENDMLRLIGKKSSEISGVVKANEYTPSEFAACFPQMPPAFQISIYSFIGGKSLYYNDINDETTLRDMVILWLNRWMSADFDINSYLPEDIREPAVYNTILLNIASGTEKPGDLHEITGIERAKLSVYLKKLIEYGVVDKVVTGYSGDREVSRRGEYRISDRLVRFYYRYIFPHDSLLLITGADRFYRRFIEPEIDGFIEEAYPEFCIEQIKWLNREGRLNFKVASVEEFYDRYKAIDFIIVAAGGSVIACACKYSSSHMTYKTYEDVKLSVRKNRLMCDNIWLFCAGGFDQKLSAFAEDTPGLKLIEGKDQRLR